MRECSLLQPEELTAHTISERSANGRATASTASSACDALRKRGDRSAPRVRRAATIGAATTQPRYPAATNGGAPEKSRAHTNPSATAAQTYVTRSATTKRTP